MALIKCSECGKEISDKAVCCPHCGYPIINHERKNDGNDTVQGGKTTTMKNKKIIIAIVIAIVVALVGIIVVFGMYSSSSKEYCEGLKWGTSIMTVEKEHPDWTYSEDNGCYFELVDSLEGYSEEDGMIDMNFYFDEDDKLNKIEANIVKDDAEDAILYFVEYFNEIYGTDYEAAYDTEYSWSGDKSNINIFAGTAFLTITYEDAKW